MHALILLAVLAHGPSAPAIDPEGLKKEVRRSNGRTTIVHFWSRESSDELAALQKLKSRYRIVTVAVDDPDRVSTALSKSGFGRGTFVNRDGADFSPEYVRWLEPALSDLDVYFAPLPRTYVVTKDGRVAYAMGGKGSVGRIATLLK